MNNTRWIAIVGAAAMLLPPAALVAQADQGASQQTEPQGAMTPGETQTTPGPNGATGAQPEVPSSMRETLGAPGLMGRQMADKEFLRTATQEGIADVKLGQLAGEKGGPDVKTFAQKIVPDHQAIDKALATIADSLAILLPNKMSKDDQAEYDKLNRLSGKAFDTEYLTFILKTHWTMVYDFYMEASAAVDPELAAEVVKAMQTMHTHLGMIAQVAKEEGIALPPRPRLARPAAAPAAPAAKK
jgi:putative membrane protein